MFSYFFPVISTSLQVSYVFLFLDERLPTEDKKYAEMILPITSFYKYVFHRMHICNPQLLTAPYGDIPSKAYNIQSLQFFSFLFSSLCVIERAVQIFEQHTYITVKTTIQLWQGAVEVFASARKILFHCHPHCKFGISMNTSQVIISNSRYISQQLSQQINMPPGTMFEETFISIIHCKETGNEGVW